MIRPGRFDVKIEFTNATADQTQDLFKHFYPVDWLNEQSEDAGVKDCTCGSGAVSEKGHIHHDLQANYTQHSINTLALEFADVLAPAFEGKGVSMAALQAYLLTKKDDPKLALAGAAEWANEQAQKSKAVLEEEEKIQKEEERLKKLEEEKLKKAEQEEEEEKLKQAEQEKKAAEGADIKPVLTLTTAEEEEEYENVNADEVIPSSPS